MFLQDNKWIKRCSCCKEIKDIIFFSSSKNRADCLNDSCKICVSKKGKIWYHKNKEKRIKQIKEYELRNVEKFRKIRRNWAKNRRKTHLQYKLKSNLSRRMREMISENSKGGRTIELLGCNIEEFKKYIESLWLENMSWDNYGNKNNNWNFDHKICCELFDLSDPNQQKICFHYSNIQPLWCINNTRKNDVIYKGKQARFLSKEEKLEYLKTLDYNF